MRHARRGPRVPDRCNNEENRLDCRMKACHTKDNGLAVFLYFPSSFSQSNYRTLLLAVSAENMGVLI